MPPRVAVIAGAGPAGLTCAYELLRRTDYVPVVVELGDQVGGLSRTVRHNGNRLDIGGHRFFSKSDRVLEWWAHMLPFDVPDSARAEIRYQGQRRGLDSALLERARPGSPRAFRLRPRVSRIYHAKNFFDYPVSLSLRTIRQLGPGRASGILASYLRARLDAGGSPRNLEEFFIQRFGRRLYETFFKSYTEKVWGLPCSKISAEWGAQRVKSLSITCAAAQALRRAVGSAWPRAQASGAEHFLYPHLGPGQLWEEAARRVASLGGEVRLRHELARVEFDGKRVLAVELKDLRSGAASRLPCDVFVSTMPVKHLLARFDRHVPRDALEAASGLEYRDFITVGLLVDRLAVSGPGGALIPDNWIYVQEPGVRLGRIQVYNNWSEGMLADASKVWLGLEYFCQEGDDLWSLSDERMAALALDELRRIGFIGDDAARDSVVVRVPKAYPAYWGAFARFSRIREFVDRVENLYLIGRNGMHRYNNQDHSMLTAMAAVDHLSGAIPDKSVIWAVNADEDYHESGVDSVPPECQDQRTFS